MSRKLISAVLTGRVAGLPLGGNEAKGFNVIAMSTRLLRHFSTFSGEIVLLLIVAASAILLLTASLWK